MKAFLVSLMLLCASVVAYGYFDTMEQDKVNAILSSTGNNNDRFTSLAALVPYEKANGHIAGFVQRQTSDDVVISEIIAGEVQGGFDVGNFEIRGIIDLERDIDRGIGFGKTISYFVSPPSVKLLGITFDTGVGNYSEDVSVLDAIGADENELSFGFTSFIDAHWKSIRSTLVIEPELDFNDLQAEFAIGIVEPISDELSVGVNIKVIADTNPIAGEKINIQHTVFAQWEIR